MSYIPVKTGECIHLIHSSNAGALINRLIGRDDRSIQVTLYSEFSFTIIDGKSHVVKSRVMDQEQATALTQAIYDCIINQEGVS